MTLTIDQVAAPGSALSHVLNGDLLRLEGVFRQAGEDLRVIGGAVRDLVLGAVPRDIDLSTTASPETMVACLGEAGIGIRYIPTGLRFGTVLAVVEGQPFQITSLRGDGEERTFETDAGHRDFTINGMSLDAEGRLYDYHNGLQDLRSRRVRFIGNARDRIAEDPVRVLRYYRFYGSVRADGFDADLDMIFRESRDAVATVSRERVWAEIRRILATPRAASLVRRMEINGIAEAIGLPRGDRKLLQVRRGGTDHPAALAGVYLTSESDVERLADRWRLSDKDRRLALLAHRHRTLCPTLGQAHDAIAASGRREDWAEIFRMYQQDTKADYILSGRS